MTRPLPYRPAFVLLALAAVAPAATAGTAIVRTTPPEAAVDAVFARYDSKDTPGCSVAVIDGGKVLLEKSYGMADPSLGVPRTSRTSHWIPYSEARVFVALAVAMLARDGNITLDDPIRQHIPQLPAYASAVTVRQLLHHRSGLADYLVLDPAGDSMWTRVSEDEFFRVLARWNKLGFAPGTSKMYSNTDYALLEMLVERVSGGSLHDYLDPRLLEPLGMADTRIGADQATVYPGHVLFHDGDGSRRIFPYRTSPVGGISVTTSLHDLIRWDSALRDPASGLSLLLTQLETGAPRDAGSNVEGDPSDAGGFAFGVYRRTFRDLPLLEYRGVSGYHYLVQVPGTELSVATLCNAYPGMASFGAEVARLFAAPRDAATAGNAMASTPPPALGPAIAVPPAELQRYAGEYRNSRGQFFTIAVAGNGLVTTPRGGSPFPPLLPMGDGKFRAQFGESTYLLTFKPGDDSEMVMTAWDVTLNESGGDDLRRWALAPPEWATAEAFAAYPGTYVGDDVDAFMYVRVEGGRVFVASHGFAETALEPMKQADRFDGHDIYETRFERDASGRVIALVLDAARVKGMRYTRR